MNEIIGIVFITIGLMFDLFGFIGIIRLPDVYTRLQASTKCVTLGTCGIMLGVVFFKGFSPSGIKAIMCIVFLFLASPVAAHALAKGAYKSGVKLCKGSVCDAYKDVKDK